MINNNIYPRIPSRGSVGASGDLAPMSQVALLMMGEGEAFYQGDRMPAVVTHHALRLTGRTRRVHHRGQVLDTYLRGPFPGVGQTGAIRGRNEFANNGRVEQRTH